VIIEIDGKGKVQQLVDDADLPRYIMVVILINKHELRNLLLALTILCGFIAGLTLTPLVELGYYDFATLANDTVLLSAWVIGGTGFPIFLTLTIFEYVVVERMLNNKYPWFARIAA